MSSYNSLNSVSKTLARRIWNAVADDKELQKIIKSEEEISFELPQETKSKSAKTQVSIYLYNVTELTSMRNQPQNPKEPHILLHLNLHYLITPLTGNAQTDQILLGKILQVFAETPVLRGSDLQGSLCDTKEELRITIDALGLDEQSKLWTMLSTPHKLSVCYSVYPVRIESVIPPKPVVVKQPKVPLKGSIKA